MGTPTPLAWMSGPGDVAIITVRSSPTWQRIACLTCSPIVLPKRSLTGWRDVLSTLLSLDARRSAVERCYLQTLCAEDADIARTCDLVHRFLALVRNRQGARLADWIATGEQQGCPELRRFATGLRDDMAAVTVEWNNGVVEGNINRLK